MIWVEGSIYLMGFGKTMGLWKKYLKPTGFIVFSELCRFENDRPGKMEMHEKSSAYYEYSFSIVRKPAK